MENKEIREKVGSSQTLKWEEDETIFGVIEKHLHLVQQATRKDERAKVIEEIKPIIEKAINAMIYAGCNYDGSKYENFNKAIIDSTSPSDTLYISINEFETLLNSLKEIK